MKKTYIAFFLSAAIVLSLAGCSRRSAAAADETPVLVTEAPAETQPSGESEPQMAETQTPGESEPQTVEPSETAAPARRDGERFEDVIMLEGMEETVHYEHVRNEALGFEMDYDYEFLDRYTEAEREIFVSVWDDPNDPEDYLEVRADTGNAELVADAIIATLSDEYDIMTDYVDLDRAGRSIRIVAEVIKGTNNMAEHLQTVYVIPASDGCRVATEHCFITEAEGFGRRFSYMVRTLSVIERLEKRVLSDEMALAAIRNYCFNVNPDLAGIVNAGEYPVSWEIDSGDEQEVVILFRSYTGAESRYYIDRATGDAYVTEFVPGITPEEERTDESLNVWDHLD